MAHMTTMPPAARLLARPARCCPVPCPPWRLLPASRQAHSTTVGAAAAPPAATASSSSSAAAPAPAPAAPAPRRQPVVVATASAVAAAVAAPAAATAGCNSCCGAGAAGTAVGSGTAVAVGSGTAAGSVCVFGVSAGALFGLSSAVMVPVYGMMAFLPRLWLTRALLLNSSALYLGLALLYGAVLAGAWQAGLGAALAAVAGSFGAAVTAAVAGGGGGGALAAVDLTPLARMFSEPLVTLLCWIHLLALDALMARDIALDGIRTGTPTAHSVLLCFFFGPTGLLSHAATRLLLLPLRSGARA